MPYLRLTNRLLVTHPSVLMHTKSASAVTTFVPRRCYASKGKNRPKLKDPNLLRSQALINNEWISGPEGRTFPVIDPSTLSEIASIPELGRAETVQAINFAHEAFKKWGTTTAKERHDVLKRWYQLMMEHQDDLGAIITMENGKPLKEAKGEVVYGASFIEWFAEEAVRNYGDVIPSPIPSQRFVVLKQPVGVVGVITPWNFPTAMLTRKLGAAIAAGCTTVVKPAHQTPLSALAMTELAIRAGMPPGVINIITSQDHVPEIGQELCTNTNVKKISFTGSTGVGKKLMEQASSTVKRVSLELGGNAPFIVFDDADVEKAVEGAIASKFRGSGQTCVCANRILVQRGIYNEFASLLSQRVNKFHLGDGFDPETTHGPLIDDRAVKKVRYHVEDAVKGGAEILVGGKASELGPNFFEPTVLSGVSPDSALANEETFGPVAGLFSFESDEEAVELANATKAGLAGYLYSRDVGRCWKAAERMETGMVGVNVGIVSSVYGPFGGIKESGLGREGSKYGIADYTDTKFVVLGL